MIQTILAGLVAIATLVVVHEFGHFVIAKIFKVGVPVFSIGMGPRLFGFVYGGTDYRVSWLPIGGYVRMAGADPFGEMDEGDECPPESSLLNKPIWQRLLILLGGPGANLLLPVIVFTIAALMGETVPGSTVGQVVHDSPAALAGFEVADKVVEVDGHSVDQWFDFAAWLQDDPENSQTVVVERRGQKVTLMVAANSVPVKLKAGRNPLDDFGLMHRQLRSQLGVDDPTSPAAQAGLVTGDVIVAVDGVEVTTWTNLMAELKEGGSHKLDIKRAIKKDEETPAIEELTVVLAESEDWAPRESDYFQNPWGLVPVDLFVGSLMDGKPAQAAGIRSNDRIYAVNGLPVKDFSQLGYLVAQSVEGIETELASAGSGGCFGGVIEKLEVKPLKVTVGREGKLHELQFTPILDRELGLATTHWRPLMGIMLYPDAWSSGTTVTAQNTVPEALGRGIFNTYDIAKKSLMGLGGLLTGGTRVKDSVGGPVRIFNATGKAAAGGWLYYIKFLALISISLGVVNLLPVPVLDGGQILIYSIEGIRGRPVSPVLRERLQMIGVLFLFALLLAVTFFDIEACITGGT